MINSHVGTEKRICFISLCFSSPYFECTAEKTGDIDGIVAEAKNLRVRYFSWPSVAIF